jgi:hypothetical protein
VVVITHLTDVPLYAKGRQIYFARGFDMKVFGGEWIRELSVKYKSESEYSRPFIVPLALDSRFSLERVKIEKWFDALPEDSKSDMLKRLRSDTSQQHFGAYYELVTGQFFKSLGYLVDVHPCIRGSNPDLLIRGKNLNKPIVVEVATVFDDPDWQKEEKKLNLILKELSKIKHFFLLSLHVELAPIPEKIDYASLKQFIVSWFDSFDPNVTETTQETKYEINGLKLSLLLFPKKPEFRAEKGSIIGGHGLPARWVGHDQLRNALRKKIAKYTFVKEEHYPYIVALSLYETFSRNKDIVDILFGKTQWVVKLDKTGGVAAEHGQRGEDGLCKPNRSTRLSGVIAIKTTGAPDSKGKIRRTHQVALIRNPHASIQLSDDFLNGYPQFKKTMDNGSSRTYDWVDGKSNLFFDC